MRAAPFVLVLLLLPLVFAAPAPLYESWGTPSWRIVTGTGILPACEGANCFLLATLPAGATDHARYRHPLALPLAAQPLVSFRFWGASSPGNTDALVQVGFDNLAHLHVELTESSSNNAVALHTTGSPRLIAGTWAPGAWYTARVTFDQAAHSASLALLDANGAVVGAAGPTPLPAGAQTITAIDVQGRNWGGPIQPFRFDDIRVGSVLEETFSGVPSPWVVEGLARADCHSGKSPCSLEVTSICCGTYTRVSRSVTTAEGAPFRVAFDFLPPSSGYTQIDAVVQIRLDHGDLNIELTETDSNRAVAILSSTGVRTVVGSWTPGRWEHVTVDVDPSLHVATLRLDGALLPGATVLYPDAQLLQGISFQGVRWGSLSTGAFDYDNLQVVPLG